MSDAASPTAASDADGAEAKAGDSMVKFKDDAPVSHAVVGAQVGEYAVQIGSQQTNLPMICISPDLAIALLMTIDMPLNFITQAGVDLAHALCAHTASPAALSAAAAALSAASPRCAIDAVASAATLGIPLGAAVATALGLERQFVLQKTAKKHLSDALIAPLRSTTTEAEQSLRLDRRWVPMLAGKRVVFVDDVISSGNSCRAALSLLRTAGAIVVGVGVALAEGDGWRSTLANDAELVVTLGGIPLFKRNATATVESAWAPSWTE